MLYRIPEKFHAVDAHTHLNFILGANYDFLDVEEARRVMECNAHYGIEKACVSMPYMKKSVTSQEVRKGNDLIFEAMKFSDHFIGFCFVDPGNPAAACDEILRCVRDGGMVGVKLYHQYRVDDPVLDPVFELCSKLNCPVLVHAVKGVNPPTLSNAEHFVTAARRFPEVKFIQAHIGGGGDWEWNLRVLENSTPNHYIDTSGSVIDVGMIRQTVEVMGADRVLFATDMFIEEGVGKLLDAGLDDAAMQKICCDNIRSLLAGKLK